MHSNQTGQGGWEGCPPRVSLARRGRFGSWRVSCRSASSPADCVPPCTDRSAQRAARLSTPAPRLLLHRRRSVYACDVWRDRSDAEGQPGSQRPREALFSFRWRAWLCKTAACGPVQLCATLYGCVRFCATSYGFLPYGSLLFWAALCSSVWLCMALCSFVRPCTALCSSVWLCTALCSSVWLCTAFAARVALYGPMQLRVVLCDLCRTVWLCVALSGWVRLLAAQGIGPAAGTAGGCSLGRREMPIAGALRGPIFCGRLLGRPLGSDEGTGAYFGNGMIEGSILDGF